MATVVKKKAQAIKQKISTSPIPARIFLSILHQFSVVKKKGERWKYTETQKEANKHAHKNQQKRINSTDPTTNQTKCS